MAEEKKSNTTLLLVIIVIALAAVGYYVYQEQNTETVGIKIGDQEISATIEE